MSFRIHSHAAAACPTLGAQERQAQGRSLHHRGHGVATPHRIFGDPENGLHDQANSSLAIRRAQDCQAVLGDALGLLQTQDEALARLKAFLNSPTPSAEILEESFNGLPVFSHHEHADPLWIENIETPEAVEVPRPPVAFWLQNSPADLEELLTAARDTNHRAQLHIERVLEANRVQLLEAELAPHQLARREEAQPCLEISRAGFLTQPDAALFVQANSSQESVLRLFQ